MQRVVSVRVLVSLWLFGLGACGSDSGSANVNGDAGGGGTSASGGNGLRDAGPGPIKHNGCTPTQAEYEAVRPLFEQWCSTCHTSPPQYGAPFSLLDYDSVLGDHRGETIVSHLVHVMTDRIMPPAGQPQPSEFDRQTILDFATCQAGVSEHGDGGHVHDEPTQLTATREPLVAGDTPPAGATSRELTAQEFALAANARDHYETFSFTKLTSSDVFMRRFDAVIDDARVVHHLTLRFSQGREGYVYTWAPGGPSIEFPNGGVRLTPNDTLRLEIHYNNGAGATDVRDSSGVRIWMAPPSGTEYGLANLATWQIVVPARGTSSAHATCNVQKAVRVFAAAPHMHEVGDSFTHTIQRAAGGTEDLISLTGWAFTAQRYYQVGVDLMPGDTLKMQCNYKNSSSRLVTAGVGTADEMCFDFMYVTPPDALANCNDGTSL